MLIVLQNRVEMRAWLATRPPRPDKAEVTLYATDVVRLLREGTRNAERTRRFLA